MTKDLSVVLHELQVDKILRENGLDFTIEKRRLVDVTDHNRFDMNSEPEETPYYGLKNMKTNKYIYSCSEGYHVSQTRDLVDLTLKGCKGFGELRVTKGGSLNGGKKTFLQLGIDGIGRVGNDSLSRYLTVLDSNDGSSAVSIGVGNITASCANQFNKFYKVSMNKILHSSTMEEKLKELPSIISMALSEELKLIEMLNEFESTVISRDLAHRMVDYIVGIDKTMNKAELNKQSSKKVNTMNSVYSHIAKETEQKGMNLWGLHSGITSFTTHDKSVMRRTNGRVESLLIGSGYTDNQKSFAFCTNVLNGTMVLN